jgi:hypothetical protein
MKFLKASFVCVVIVLLFVSNALACEVQVFNFTTDDVAEIGVHFLNPTYDQSLFIEPGVKGVVETKARCPRELSVKIFNKEGIVVGEFAKCFKVGMTGECRVSCDSSRWRIIKYGTKYHVERDE